MGNLNRIKMSTVTSTGGPFSITVQGKEYREISVINTTKYGLNNATPAVGEARWFEGMASGSALTLSNTAAAYTTAWGQVAAPTGITLGATFPVIYGPAMTITSITQANPAVVTVNSTGSMINGDTVWLSAATGMSQIIGMPFTVGNVTATTFTLAYMNTAAFAAPATGGTAFIVYGLNQQVIPDMNYVSALTTASVGGSVVTNATLTVAIGNTLQVNQHATFLIASSYGNFSSLAPQPAFGYQANVIGFQITAINTTTNTVTLSTPNATPGTLVYPSNTYAAAYPSGSQPKPQIIPTGTNWQYYNTPQTSVNENYILIGSAVCGAAGDIMFISAVVNDE